MKCEAVGRSLGWSIVTGGPFTASCSVSTRHTPARSTSPTGRYFNKIAATGSQKSRLKTGYIEFAWLESYADATPVVMLSPAVAMAGDISGSPVAGE